MKNIEVLYDHIEITVSQKFIKTRRIMWGCIIQKYFEIFHNPSKSMVHIEHNFHNFQGLYDCIDSSERKNV